MLDSAFVENAGPSMQRYVPPRLAFTPAVAHDEPTTSDSCGQKGSAKLTCATSPSPKNVEIRPRVRSKNWSGITKSSGLCSSFSDPTALKERIRSTPSDLN